MPAPAPVERPPDDLPPLSILLAEDSPINQKVTSAWLTRFGCKVTLAQNGAQAIDLAAQQEFDVILMDCHMPEVDGFTAAARIRALGGRRVPIIALTANVMPEDRAQCLAQGMDDFLSKPFRPTDLQAILSRWTGSRGASVAGKTNPTPKMSASAMAHSGTSPL